MFKIFPAVEWFFFGSHLCHKKMWTGTSTGKFLWTFAYRNQEWGVSSDYKLQVLVSQSSVNELVSSKEQKQNNNTTTQKTHMLQHLTL